MRKKDHYGRTLASDVEVTPLKNSPGVIDEIKAGFETCGKHDWSGKNNPLTVHIERMDKHYYWCRVGNFTFKIKSAVEKGPGIVIEVDPCSETPKEYDPLKEMQEVQ